MEHSNRPTRAEASDVFNAVLDGADAVMLSGESAIGRYPVESVTTMRRICAEAEAHMQLQQRRQTVDTPASLVGLVQPVTEAIVDAACLAAEQLNAPVIVVATASGRTALALSNRRPGAMILALTPTEQTARVLTMCWGVTPLVLPKAPSVDQELAFAINWATSHRLVHPGQHVVFLRGEVPGQIQSRAVLAYEVP
jgi:pyruvate kinase